MNMFRRLALSTMAFSLELLLLGSTIPEPTFRPTRQELLRPPTRSWLVHGACRALPAAGAADSCVECGL